MTRQIIKRVCGIACLCLLVGCTRWPATTAPPPVLSRVSPDEHGVFHVSPDDPYSIQEALDAAALHATSKTVRVHAGTYRPQTQGLSLIHLVARHDGIRLEAEGKVVLTAANAEISDANLASHPAIVNHVVYIGDGISEQTVVSGFEITGANGYIAPPDAVDPDDELDHPALAQKGAFYYLDGGAVKIFGRSYPQLLDLNIHDNVTRLCAGGVSIEHRGLATGAVVMRNCRFMNNRCPATGPAVDVLEGSAAIIENCLFVGNIGNSGMEAVKRDFGLAYNEEHGSGALTVFPGSRVKVRRCTFAKNWNGVDDRGQGNVYEHCLFVDNDVSDGSRTGRPYEMDILDARGVKRCFFSGHLGDLRGTISLSDNRFSDERPELDEFYQPVDVDFSGVGYRRLEKTRTE